MKSWFTLFGSPRLTIRVHYTWLLVLSLGMWSLVSVVLPNRLGEGAALWTTAALIMAGYVGCVAVHELAHLGAAKLLNVPMPALNVHPIGALARLGREEVGPNRTFAVAAAGPLANLLLWFMLSRVTVAPGTTQAIVLDFLRSFTFVIGAFNLLPGLPLDGGRMLRAIIWRGSTFQEGTLIATAVGYVVAAGTLFVGLRTLTTPETTLRGMWIVLLAWLFYAAGTTLRRRRTVGTLFRRLTAGDVMLPAGQQVAPTVTLRQLVDSWGSNTGENPTPVVANGQLVGLIGRRQASDVPQGYWDERTVADAMQPISEVKTTTPTTPLAEVLPQLDNDEFNAVPLLVAFQGRLMGMIDTRDVGPLLDVHELLGMQHVPSAAQITSKPEDNVAATKRNAATL